jgi:hypothetical protein
MPLPIPRGHQVCITGYRLNVYKGKNEVREIVDLVTGIMYRTTGDRRLYALPWVERTLQGQIREITVTPDETLFSLLNQEEIP